MRFLRVPLNEVNKTTVHNKTTYQTDDYVLDFVNVKMGVALDRSEIGRSHIVGKTNETENTCGIIVKFVGYNSRQKVFSNKRNLKGKGTKVHISEDMTFERFATMKKLGALRNNNNVSTYWSTDGRIFFKKADSGSVFRVTYTRDLIEHFTPEELSSAQPKRATPIEEQD